MLCQNEKFLLIYECESQELGRNKQRQERHENMASCTTLLFYDPHDLDSVMSCSFLWHMISRNELRTTVKYRPIHHRLDELDIIETKEMEKSSIIYLIGVLFHDTSYLHDISQYVSIHVLGSRLSQCVHYRSFVKWNIISSSICLDKPMYSVVRSWWGKQNPWEQTPWWMSLIRTYNAKPISTIIKERKSSPRTAIYHGLLHSDVFDKTTDIHTQQEVSRHHGYRKWYFSLGHDWIQSTFFSFSHTLRKKTVSSYFRLENGMTFYGALSHVIDANEIVHIADMVHQSQSYYELVGTYFHLDWKRTKIYQRKEDWIGVCFQCTSSFHEEIGLDLFLFSLYEYKEEEDITLSDIEKDIEYIEEREIYRWMGYISWSMLRRFCENHYLIQTNE